jgi:flagellar biosynthesis/type III secretory pathway protein FliH
MKNEIERSQLILAARDKALAEGRAEGRAEGEAKGKAEVLALMKQGLSYEEIEQRLKEK